MDIGELLDAAINLYRVHWKTLMAIAATLLVPINFLQSYTLSRIAPSFSTFPTEPFEVPTTPQPFAPPGSEVPDFGPFFTSFLAFFGVTLLFSLVVSSLLTASIARAAGEIYQGRDLEVGTTLGFALRRVHSIMWVVVLVAVIRFGGYMLCFIPGIFFQMRFVLSPSVLVIEGAKGTNALRRAWRLSANHFWKIFGIVLLTWLITALIGGVFQAPFVIAGAFFKTWGWVLTAIGGSIGQMLILPFSAIVRVLLYFDMRIRKEGFDLAMMAEALAVPE